MEKLDRKHCKRSYNSFEGKEKGKQNLVKLNGYWIWWCYRHQQPLAWCEKQEIEEKLDAIKKIV